MAITRHTPRPAMTAEAIKLQQQAARQYAVIRTELARGVFHGHSDYMYPAHRDAVLDAQKRAASTAETARSIARLAAGRRLVVAA